MFVEGIWKIRNPDAFKIKKVANDWRICYHTERTDRMNSMDKEINEISPKAFIHMFGEAQKYNRRFCFILGSGASREGGIPTGVEMAKIWAEELKNKYEEKELQDLMKKLDIQSITPTSENYFGIYDLRYYPDYQEGYAYFERELEKGVPSLGHHALAKVLAGKTHNLAITTNFDSLIEDALFIYANKHPLLVGHESLAGFINLNVDRPIVAKIHRSLYFHPYNRQDETHGLDQEWQETLKNAFMVYTPVVIGYAGGDQSLMEFLKDENVKMNGLYWCYWKKETPSQEIIDLVKSKNGCLIPIEGFDYFMYMLSRKMGFENPDEEMRKVTEDRIERYNGQYDTFEKMIRTEAEQNQASNEALNEILNEMDTYNDEQIKEAKKEETVHNYKRIGRIYTRVGKYDKAIEAYTAAINLSPEDADNYYNRGNVYADLKEYNMAVEDFTKSIEINPKDDKVYNDRGYCYDELGEYPKAVEDYTKAIEYNPQLAIAYSNRGRAYFNMEDYQKALNDFIKAIELKPDFANAYNNRGYTYSSMGEYQKAIDDLTKAIEIKPQFPNPYKHMGTLKYECQEYEEALEYLNKAIGLRESYKEAYEIRAKVYHALGEHEKAKKDEERVETLSDTEN